MLRIISGLSHFSVPTTSHPSGTILEQQLCVAQMVPRIRCGIQKNQRRATLTFILVFMLFLRTTARPAPKFTFYPEDKMPNHPYSCVVCICKWVPCCAMVPDPVVVMIVRLCAHCERMETQERIEASGAPLFKLFCCGIADPVQDRHYHKLHQILPRIIFRGFF